MRCLEKDRTRRYQAAGDLADDVSRYLRGDSVNACPPTFRYRFGKFVSRNKTPVTVAASFLFVLVVSSALAWVLFLSARTARNDALLASAKETTARMEAERARKKAEQQHLELARYLYSDNISAASQAFKESDFATMRSRLKICPEDQRGWEWHRLNCLAQSRRILWLKGPQVTSVAASPTELELAVTDINGGLRLHALDGPGQVWSKHIDVPNPNLLFCPNGSLIVVFNRSAIEVVDSETGEGQKFRKDVAGGPPLFEPAVSPDGRFLIVTRGQMGVNANGSIELVDLHDQNRILWNIDTPGFPRCCFSQSGDRIFAVAMSGESGAPSTLLCFDRKHGSEIWRQPLVGNSVVQLSPDGRQVLISGKDGTLRGYDVDGGEFQKSYSVGSIAPPVLWAHFSSDKRYAWFMDGMGNVALRDWESQSEIQSFRLANAVDGGIVAFTADNLSIVTRANGQAPIELHDIKPLDLEFPMMGHASMVESVAFSQEGLTLTSVSRDGTLRQWDTSSGRELVTRAAHPVAYTLAILPCGKFVATGGSDGLKIWSCNSWNRVRFWKNTKPYWLAWTPDGSTLLAAEPDGVVRSWNVQDGTEKATSAGYGQGGLAVLDENRFAALGHGKIMLGDIESLDFRELSPDQHIRSRCLAAHPDGKILAAGVGFEVQLWDTEKRELVGTLMGGTAMVQALAFSPDGERLFSTDREGWIRVWNHSTKQELMSFLGHQVPFDVGDGHIGIHTIAVSNDGKTLATGGHDKLVKLWETTRPPRVLAEKRRVVRTAVQAISRHYSAAESPADVLELLEKDEALTRGERSTAIDIAETRGDWFPTVK
jgi:WD40 repeat protein